MVMFYEDITICDCYILPFDHKVVKPLRTEGRIVTSNNLGNWMLTKFELHTNFNSIKQIIITFFFRTKEITKSEQTTSIFVCNFYKEKMNVWW